MALTRQDVTSISQEIRLARQLAQEARQFEALQTLRVREQEFRESEAALAGSRQERELDIRSEGQAIYSRQVETNAAHMKYLEEGDKDVPYGKYSRLFDLNPNALPADTMIRLSTLATAAQARSQLLGAQAALARSQDMMKSWQYDQMLATEVTKADGELFKLTKAIPGPKSFEPMDVPLPGVGTPAGNFFARPFVNFFTNSNQAENVTKYNMGLLQDENSDLVKTGRGIVNHIEDRAVKGLPMTPQMMGYAQTYVDKVGEFKGAADRPTGYKVEGTMAYKLGQEIQNALRGYNYLRESALSDKEKLIEVKGAVDLMKAREAKTK